MSGYRTINRNKYGGRRDVKEMSKKTKQEIFALDPDIVGRGDELDDDDVEQSRAPRRGYTETIKITNNLAIRQANQLLNSGAGKSNRNIVCTIVTVRHAASSGLKHVLESISKYLDTFRPIAPQIREQDVEFFITDEKEAEAIRALSRRIVDKRNRNSRFIIQTRKTAAPWTALDRRIRDIMVNVLSKRYNKTYNSLDLSDFGADKDFTTNKIIVSLTRNDVLVALFDMIEKDYCNITQLSLKDNRLRSFVFLSSLVFRCKNVNQLDISSNEFKNIEDLDRISLWNIEKLLLENNPFCTNYSDADTYTRDVHKYLPTVSYLDGIHVTPSAVKTEDRSALLPKPRLSYCDSDAVRRVVEKFLQEFIQHYDSQEPEARKQLIAAYDDNAEFSYSINVLEHQSRGDIEIYQTYMRGSRNIVFEDRWASNPDRVRYKGSMEIAVQLAKLPTTKHLVETFLLDVDFYIDNLCGFTLRGLFIDGAEQTSPRPHYKLFMRNFLVVSTGEGTMAILCDTLQICPISEMAADNYRDMIASATLEASDLPGPSGVNQPSHPNITGSSNNVPSIVVTAPPPTPQPIDPSIKRQMIEQFAAQTGMNLAYSERCLEDNNFDYEASGRRFLEIRSQIPPEAFQQ